LSRHVTNETIVDPLSFLKSPMILMGLFSLVLIVGMPYLTEGCKFLCASRLRASERATVSAMLTSCSGRRVKEGARGDTSKEFCYASYKLSGCYQELRYGWMACWQDEWDVKVMSLSYIFNSNRPLFSLLQYTVP
jgi:hypothetical protein